MMSRYHYLGFRTLVGESLKYIAILDDQPVGLIGWGTAAFKSHHRDRWIGWSPEIQWQRLKFIANNMRFLILAQIKNLASKILAANVKRLSQDWRAIYGHPIILAETFVDHRRFKGTCYRAAGWTPLGQRISSKRWALLFSWTDKGDFCASFIQKCQTGSFSAFSLPPTTTPGDSYGS